MGKLSTRPSGMKSQSKTSLPKNTAGHKLIPETRWGTIYMTDVAKFQINTCNKPGKLFVDDRLWINTYSKLGELST